MSELEGKQWSFKSHREFSKFLFTSQVSYCVRCLRKCQANWFGRYLCRRETAAQVHPLSDKTFLKDSGFLAECFLCDYFIYNSVLACLVKRCLVSHSLIGASFNYAQFWLFSFDFSSYTISMPQISIIDSEDQRLLQTNVASGECLIHRTRQQSK